MHYAIYWAFCIIGMCKDMRCCINGMCGAYIPWQHCSLLWPTQSGLCKVSCRDGITTCGMNNLSPINLIYQLLSSPIMVNVVVRSHTHWIPHLHTRVQTCKEHASLQLQSGVFWRESFPPNSANWPIILGRDSHHNHNSKRQLTRHQVDNTTTLFRPTYPFPTVLIGLPRKWLHSRVLFNCHWFLMLVSLLHSCLGLPLFPSPSLPLWFP